MTLHKLILGAFCSLIPACIGIASGDAIDAVNAEASNPSDPADTADSVFYKIRADTRECFAPGCGGYFVQRVNREITVCADGNQGSECYVNALDTTALNLDSTALDDLRNHADAFLLRGSIAQQDVPGASSMGVFRATEAWRGHEGRVPQGMFDRVTSSGIECITFPCLTYTAALLNSDSPPQNIGDVNFAAFGGNTDDARTQINRPEGILVAGQPSTVSGPGGTAQALAVNEYYLPYTKSVASVPCNPASAACGPNMFCNYPASASCGKSNVPGVCTNPPQACSQIYQPVCGCDGKTYANACAAASATISVDHDGEC